MNTRISFPTKEQFEAIASFVPIHKDAFVVNHREIVDMSVYAYKNSPVARAYIDLLLILHDQQAKLDAIMFEYEPETITSEQIEEWSLRQRVCSPETKSKIKKSLEGKS